MRWPKIHKRALEATIAGEVPTDARRQMGEPGHAAPDPEMRKRARFHRRVAAFVIGVVFVVGGVLALFGKGGYLDLRGLHGELDTARAQLELQQQRVNAERTRVKRLHHRPEARERIAREELGFSSPGEITFILPEETAPVAPATPSR